MFINGHVSCKVTMRPCILSVELRAKVYIQHLVIPILHNINILYNIKVQNLTSGSALHEGKYEFYETAGWFQRSALKSSVLCQNMLYRNPICLAYLYIMLLQYIGWDQMGLSRLLKLFFYCSNRHYQIADGTNYAADLLARLNIL